MKHCIRKLFVCAALVGLASAAKTASAAEFCSDVKIVEISAGHGTSVEYDLSVQVNSTTGSIFFDHIWTWVRHSSYGHTGVQRIERLATAALLSGKTMYWCYEDPSYNVTRVYLK